ncbi:MAG: Ig-like domain-containing protein [Microcoleaceae cyanobacterium]
MDVLTGADTTVRLNNLTVQNAPFEGIRHNGEGILFAIGSQISNNDGQGIGAGGTVDVKGSVITDNGRDGILLTDGGNRPGISDGSVIGGSNPGEGNLISGNGIHGIALNGSSQNTILGNQIGTNAAGDATQPNGERGIFLSSNANNNTIGGSGADEGNLISGNTQEGIAIEGSSQNTILGNRIGTDITGSSSLTNGENGILISSGGNNIIGGSGAGEGNLISGNARNGISIETSDQNTVLGNQIGTNLAGDTALPNGGVGVTVNFDSTDNIVGGGSPGAGNLISGNGGRGVEINNGSNQNQVLGNLIGLDTTGTFALPNQGDGVLIASNPSGGAANNIVNNNTISGNINDGVEIFNSNGNSLLGNRIGTNQAGDTTVANREVGIKITASSTNNTVGGTGADEGNLLSGNTNQGILIQDSDQNRITGNRIGTNLAGDQAIGNREGVVLDNASSNVLDSNLVSGNNGLSGINIDNGSDQNSITNNRIGVNQAGTTALPNADDGIVLASSSGNQISNNVISGNNDDGIDLQNGAASTVIQGNLIGVDPSGTQAIPNRSDGIQLLRNATQNTIGGNPTAGEGNLIAFNGNDGVNLSVGFLGTTAPTENEILGNQIFSNGLGSASQIGIDLGNDGVTANDPGDSDTGPNNLQNFPELQSATAQNNQLTVEGTLNSSADETFRVELFANAIADPSGSGQGESFLLGFDVTTDANGDVALSQTIPIPVNLPFITATATDSSGNTSEFSSAIQINQAPTAIDVGVSTFINIPITFDLVAADSDPDGTVDPATVDLDPATAGLQDTLAIPSQGTFNVTPQGDLTFAPIAQFLGQVVIPYTVQDNLGATSNSANITVDVFDQPNQPPVTDNVTAPTIPGDTIDAVLPALTGSDPDGNVAQFQITEVSQSGTLSLNGSAIVSGQLIPAGEADQLTFTPNTGFSGSATFKYAAIDNLGATDLTPATYTIPVTAVDQPPITADIAGAVQSTNPPAAAPVPALVGSDPDGTVDNFRVTRLPLNGALELNGNPVDTTTVISVADAGNLTFTPNQGFSGISSFQYVAIDNQGVEDPTPALATLTVQPATNQPPETDDVSAPITNSTATDVALPALSGNDPDGSIAEFRITSLPQNGQVSLGGTALNVGDPVPFAERGSLTYAPEPSATGFRDETFTYAAVDDQGAEDLTPAVYTIPVVGNLPPVANTLTIDLVDNTAVDVPLAPSPSGVDLDGSIEEVTIVQLVPPGSGELLLDDDADPATPSVPVTSGQTIPATEIGNLRFTANPNFAGLTGFTYTVTDNQGAVSSNAGLLEILVQRVAPPNLPPVVSDIVTASRTPATATEPVNIAQLIGVDPEGDDITFEITTDPNRNGTLQLSDGTPVARGDFLTPDQAINLEYTPDATFDRDITFRYTATDSTGSGLESPNEATVTIPFDRDPNQAPFAENLAATALQSTDTEASINPSLAAVDPEGDAIERFNIIQLSSDGELFLNGQPVTVGQPLTPEEATELTFTPNRSFSGVTTVEYTATDDQDNTSRNVGLLQIPVLPGVVDLPPTVNSVAVNPPLDNTIAAPAALPSLQGSDPDPGDTITFRILTLPNNGQLLFNGAGVTVGQEIDPADAGNLTYDPDNSFVGVDFFSYTATDSQGVDALNDATYLIPVQQGDQPPIAANRSATPVGNDSTGVSLPALAGTDPEDGVVTQFEIASLPNSGQLLLNDNTVTIGQQLNDTEATQLTYIPDANFIGNTDFQYFAVDSQGVLSLGTATVTIPVVAAQNLPPIPADRVAPSVLNTQTDAALPALTATDPDGDAIQEFTIETLPSSGTLELNDIPIGAGDTIPLAEAGSLTYTPETNFGGQVSFSYRATDVRGATSSNAASYTIPVVQDNQPPTPINRSLTIRDTLVNVPLPSLTATDPDTGDTVDLFTITSLPQTGELFVNNTPAQLNQQIPVNQAGQLTFTPDMSGGSSRIDGFSFTATDSRSATSLLAGNFTLSIVTNLTPIVDPITARAIPNTGTAFSIPPLTATDIDGMIVSFGIEQLPSQGTLFLAGTPVTTIDQVQNLSAAEAATLSFGADTNFVGDVVFNYTATDNENGIGTAPITIPVFQATSPVDIIIPPLLMDVSGIEDLCDAPAVPDFAALAIAIPSVADVISQVDNVIEGNEEANAITGTDQQDAILGGFGDDSVDALGGEDIVDGGPGGDLLFGSFGNDTLIGDEGNAAIGGGADVILGDRGNDVITLSVGADTMYGGQENDFGYGGQDNDVMFGDLGNDTLFGDRGNDTLFGDRDDPNNTEVEGQDLLWGGAGNDFVEGNTNDDTLSGGEGEDTVRGGQQNDLVFGEAGDDLVFGDLGSDEVIGNEGNDTLYGGTGDNSDPEDDKLCGGSGDDLLFGEGGQDVLCGDDGNDTLEGGAGEDTLVAGDGDDVLQGDAGIDTLLGGAGNDRFALASDGDSDVILDFTDSEDVMQLPEGISFEDLTLTSGSSSVLVQQGTETLATVLGVTVDQITEDDFTTA